LVRFDGNRAHMRMVDGHCGALCFNLGSREFLCSDYATRPDICRDLIRGSGECRGELEAKRARPLLWSALVSSK
jgi:Fe-S-cluster containining protein